MIRETGYAVLDDTFPAPKMLKNRIPYPPKQDPNFKS
jgi:hypothetical protein